MSGPLEGVRVIDLTGTVLGPMGTQILGDAGADVIKIEAPGGDAVRYVGPRREVGMGAYFLNLNRNKRSVVLDLKRPAARAALLRLIAGADVFVHNMRPAAAERLGLGYAALAKVNPRLIHASASGFRRGSSRAEAPAYDDIIQGLSGLAALNGAAAGTDGPRYVPTVMADKITGHVLASSIGMALYHREKTGRGQALHVPMLETMLSFLLPEHLWGYTVGQPELGIGYDRMLSEHRRPFATADGYLCVIAVTDEQYARLLKVFGRDDLIADRHFASVAARAEHVHVVYGTIATELRRRTTAEWLDLLAGADVPHGRAAALEDLLEDPYLAEVGFFQAAENPAAATALTLGIPVEYDGSPATIRRQAPRLGEHTAEVLAEAGLSAAEIAALAV
ncbi:MAG: CoA transferase [Alphaproteobacteria bacterium]|nr:CoA transferase [Alphaproteobacteria bacterium]